MMKIIFFGSDDFAAAHLMELLVSGQQVVCCVTGPDKPQGRGMKVSASPVKKTALQHQIPCLQPLTLKDNTVIKVLKSYQADIFVVVAYGRLLTQEVLEIPGKLCMNVHGSLLPKYRGAAPINRAILNGEKETGVTIQKMALSLDSGDIIAQEKMAIGDEEDAGQLRQRMAEAGARLLADVLKKNPSGQFPLRPQDKSQVSWAPKLTKEMGKIDWKKPAAAIVNQVRGLKPWPGAYTFYNGKMLKILHVQVLRHEAQGAVGQAIKAGKEGLEIACGQGAVLVTHIQPEAGKAMPAHNFAVGHKIVTGTIFS